MNFVPVHILVGGTETYPYWEEENTGNSQYFAQVFSFLQLLPFLAPPAFCCCCSCPAFKSTLFCLAMVVTSLILDEASCPTLTNALPLLSSLSLSLYSNTSTCASANCTQKLAALGPGTRQCGDLLASKHLFAFSPCNSSSPPSLSSPFSRTFQRFNTSLPLHQLSLSSLPNVIPFLLPPDFLRNLVLRSNYDDDHPELDIWPPE